jgi:hypothetical protein
VRLPPGPTTDALAPAATSAGTLSAAGEALQRLPVIVQRPCICFEPISLAASTTPGHAFFRAALSPKRAQGTAAPMLKPSAVSLIWLKPPIALMSTIRSGSIKSPFILTRRSVPPARMAAGPTDPAIRPTASSIESGRM